MKKSSANRVFPDWLQEEESIRHYLTLNSGQPDIPIICIYEYARELWWELRDKSDRDHLFGRSPWNSFVDKKFPNRPYCKLRPREIAKFSNFFVRGLSVQHLSNFDHLEVVRNPLASAYDQMSKILSGQLLFNDPSRSDFQKIVDDTKLDIQETLQFYRLLAHSESNPNILKNYFNTDRDHRSPFYSFEDNVEYVIIKLDYTLGHARLVAAFSKWLKKEAGQLMESLSKNHTQKGCGTKIFSDHLKSLMYWRIFRSYKNRRLAVQRIQELSWLKKPDIRIAQLQEKEKKALKFKAFLQESLCSNIDQVSNSWKKFQRSQ